MKAFATVIKVLTALAAVAGAVYAVATYGDKIVAWAKSLIAKCPCGCSQEPGEEAPAEEAAPAEEPEAVEEAPAEEAAPAAEAPTAEEVVSEETVPAEEPVADDGAPVADEDDFEG